MSALVSIIIPVFNLEDYIENCLNSLVNQTYDNLEIICIDDGSRDKSGEKIKAMQLNDSRIVYLRQDNAGVSAARNNGLRNFHGDYVMFVDGDDYVHPQTVEILLDSIENTDYAFVYAKAHNTGLLNEKMPKINDAKCKQSDENELFSQIDGNCLGKAIWGKIYKRATLKNLDFPENITNGEDFYFMVRYICSCGCKFGFVDEALYY
ncbi:MAG: glycosyltransferase family 2 protein, partial [Ruminococcus sp.]|nr:glycosyltransferase family 2 protein [Candidatus Copronaster equi]